MRSLLAQVSRPSPFIRSGWWLPLLVGSWVVAEMPLKAQVSAASGAQSLGTVVNGVRGGSCSSGACAVGGGTAAGVNLFHRMSAFDTRGAITGVHFANGGHANVIVGVTSPFGTHIDKLVSLSNPGNLLFLSPGGLRLSGAAGFFQVNHLGLTTANKMALGGGGVFDVFSTTAGQAAGLTGNPQWGSSTLMVDPAGRAAAGISGSPGIVADGISISVDRELLIDAVDGAVQVQDSSLAVQPWQGQGGSLSLLGSDVLVEGASQLLATGPSGGGLIQIGGSWQNSNPQVRQAIRTAFGREAVADASATDRGQGGVVVVWSDVRNPYSFTTAKGVLKAEAGTQGGDGGRLETSGHHLDVAGLRVSTLALKGKTGLWLLDPSDITITNARPGIQGVGTNPTVFSTTANAADVNVGDLQGALGTSNVEIATAGAGVGAGDITLASNIAVNTPYTLTLKADRDIILNANYVQSGLGSLELLAGQGAQLLGAVRGAGNVALAGGVLVVETDSIAPLDYTGVISGANASLIKRGGGIFSMAGANTYAGSTTIQAGTLRLGDGGALADASALVVDQGATFQLSKSGAETIGSLSGAGSISLATTAAELSVGADNTSTSFSGVISGTGSLVKVGSGRLMLSGPSTYTGATRINGGVLHISNGGGLGNSSSGTVIGDGAALEISGGITLAEPLSVAGTGINAGGAIVNVSGANLLSGLLTLTADSEIQINQGVLTLEAAGDSVTGSHDLTFDGVGTAAVLSPIATGAGSLIKNGTGTLELDAANTYTGETIVNAGTLTVTGAYPRSAACNGGTSNICAAAPTQEGGGGDDIPPEDEEVAAVDETDVVDIVDETDTVGDPEVTDAVGNVDASDAVDGADAVDVADASGLYDEFDGAFTEDEINVIESVLSAVETGADDTPLLAAGPVEVDSFSAPMDAFTGADMDGDTDFSSSPTSEPAAAAELDSFEGAMALSDSAGETMLSSQGVAVDVSMGSSFTVEAQGSAESVESSTPASSSDAGSAASTSGSSAGADAGSTAPASAPVAATPGGAPVASVPAQQAVAGLNQADQAQSQALVNSVLPERNGSPITVPSVTQMQSGLSKAAASIRAGVGLGADSAGRVGPQSWLPRGLLLGSEADQLMASANTLIAARDVGGAAVLPPSFNRAAYNPAILHVRFTQAREKVGSSNNDAFLDITLISLDGEPEGRRVELSQLAFANDLRALYRQLSRQEPLQVDDPKSPSRRLYDQLFAAITPLLQQRGITTLLISADRGLQAVPFAALHNGERYFGDRYAFSLTPSLALTNLSPPTPGGGRLLAAGASEFVGLAPLPLVPTELTMMSSATTKDTALNQQFTPSTLLEQAADPRYNRVHVATHAEFLPGGPAKSKLYSGTVPIALSDFVKLRLARRDAPLDLISFSACRTALGDAESELGFAGLALQAGARSAVGTLWYVDDVATSAYFVQLYRYLDAGVPKADALQLTRQAFARGLVRVQGDQMVGPDGAVLSTGLTTAQQRRAAAGLSNPYFWAGIELLGSPW